MKTSKYSLSSLFSVLISPLLATVVVLYNVRKLDRVSFYLLSSIIGTLSFLYVPYFTDDRIRHVERFYDMLELNSIHDFTTYIVSNKLPDFVSYFIMFLSSRVSSNPDLFFLLVTTITFFIFSYVFYNLVYRSLTLKYRYFLFFVFVFSFDYVFLFSGMRFYLAASFFILGWYWLLYRSQLILSVFILMVAVFTHFAVIAVVLPCLVLYLYPKLNYKIIFVISILFLFVPPSLLFKAIEFLPLSTSYIDKAYDYLMYSDIQLSAAESAKTFRYILYFKNSWFYILGLYLLIFNTLRTTSLNTLYILLAMRNVFIGSPTITHYYDNIIVFVTVVALYDLLSKNKGISLFYVFVIYCLLNTSVEVYKNRKSFIISNIKLENIYSFSLFTKNKPRQVNFK